MRHPLLSCAALRRASVAVVLAACSAGPPAPDPARPAMPRANAASGPLDGTIDGPTGVLVFRGIPYAAPPVGELRWRPPQSPVRWTEPRSAARLGKNCMQTQPYSDIDPYAAGMSEDCLYLNVWTPSLDAPRRPVLVWIHGGGYIAGFGGEQRHDGARLASKGAVVVTLNYRLGAFGFLAHPAFGDDSPQHAEGNYGLLDQIAALRWVQRNIARFGGDSTRVTIFGESAGGFSVGALVASPLARGLFQRAILESGTGLEGAESREAAYAQAVRLADTLHVAGVGTALAAQLRAVPAETLLAAAQRTSFSPRFVVDGWVLPRTVDSALASGAANLVPVIVGSNGDEGDARFGAPARAFARFVTRNGAHAYLYLFTRVGDDSVNRKRGAYHSAEITFVFGRPHPLLENAGRTAYDSTLADAMSDYWVAFAATGDPNGAPAAGRRPQWPLYSPRDDPYLELGPTIVARAGIKRALYDSLDAAARTRGLPRP